MTAAAITTDHVLPDLPVRQWVLAVPKRLRYFLERDADLQGAALHVFLRAAVTAPALAPPRQPCPMGYERGPDGAPRAGV